MAWSSIAKDTEMCSELECGICYQSYNAGRRCPRELHCKHSFCESCLVALAQPKARETESEACLETGKIITCPLCRHITFISGEKIRAALRLDECVFERMVAAGVLEDGTADDNIDDDNIMNDENGETLPERPVEESDSSPGSRGGKFQRSLRKVWGKITGNTHNARRRRCETNCMTDYDFKDFAMMASCMF